jgi:dimethylargininase
MPPSAGTALVRPPDPALGDGLVTHLQRSAVDVALARRQWADYADALSAAFRVVEVTPAPGCPDSVFVEDTMVVVGDCALVTRPGAPSRRAEVDGARAAASELGLRTLDLEPPGTLDGGDVLKVGTTVYVGRSSRTNVAGALALARALEPFDARVVVVPVRKVLHLKSAVTALPDGSIIGHSPLVDSPGLFPRFRPVPEPAGAHVVLLGNNRLLMSAAAPRSAELFAGLGYEPVLVDISEFEKLEGCVTCLSVRIRSRPPTP